MLVLDESYHDMNVSDEEDGEQGFCPCCEKEKLLFHFTDTFDYSVEIVCCRACEQRANSEERAALLAEMEE